MAKQVAIAVENAIAYDKIATLTDNLAQEKVYLEDEIRTELNFEEIVGSSDALRHVLRQVETVAPTDSTVLIYGETGTGKELIARALHTLSARKGHAFVKLNCAAIPTGLLESELFGHERGTGAVAQRVGRFELAQRGIRCESAWSPEASTGGTGNSRLERGKLRRSQEPIECVLRRVWRGLIARNSGWPPAPSRRIPRPLAPPPVLGTINIVQLYLP